MYNDIKNHLGQALHDFSKGDHYDFLIEAKKKYFQITGQADEENDDFEGRMNSFNDWYLFHYKTSSKSKSIIEKYAEASSLDQTLFESFVGCRYSLFEYSGRNLKKKYILKDLISGKKIILGLGHPDPALVKNDLFIGRFLSYNSDHYLMDGIVVLPNEVKAILKKEAKKINRINDLGEEYKFLLRIEFLKTKWSHYGHVDIRKIFNFSELTRENSVWGK